MSIDNSLYFHDSHLWWDRDGYLQLLRYGINPARFDYFREIILTRLGRNPHFLRVLDIGCGGGVLAESFARAGCNVTGIDRAAPTLSAARRHAARSGLSISYKEASAEDLPFAAEIFDVVCCCDVLEHVNAPFDVISEAARVLKPNGIFFFDTINRTLASRLIVEKMVQHWRITRIFPRHMHDWKLFIKPSELRAFMGGNGICLKEAVGLAPPPNYAAVLLDILRLKLNILTFSEFGGRVRFRRSRNKSISYMGYGIRCDLEYQVTSTKF